MEENLKISEMTELQETTGSEELPLAHGGENYKVKVANLKKGLLTETQADGKYQAKGAYVTSESLTETLGGYVTSEQLAGKVSGNGVTAISVVAALPEEPVDGVIYIVTGEEA